MIKIFFDHQIFSLQQYGGISRYFCELATCLTQSDGIHVDIFPFFHQNMHLFESGLPRKGRYFGPIKKTTFARFILNTLFFEIVNHAFRPDIVHRTYYGNINIGRAKYVTTIHDFITEKYPHQFDNVDHFIRLKRKAILSSDHVICVSHSTKEDLLSYYPVPETKLSVIHLASSIYNVDLKENPYTENIQQAFKKPYLLYIGAREGYKNFNTLLLAIAESNTIKNDFNLICFGGPGFTREESTQMAALQLDQNILHTTGDDNLLSHLYRNAAMFVYPSLYEGFGIPIVEAMSMSCPVVCSNIAVFREVADDAAEMFDPTNASSICHSLETVLYSSDRREALIAKGLSNARRFSWSYTAVKTLSVYQNLISG